MYKQLRDGLKIPVHQVVGVTEEVKNMTTKDLLILDEADNLLLDQLIDLPAKSYGVLAMTATDVGHRGGNEERLLN